MIRKGKLYSRPKKIYESARIKEENVLLDKYGLKNKREIWKTIAKVDYFRRRAKALAKESPEEQQALFNKLKNLGLNTNSITDVLALHTENLFERRLPTVVAKRGLAKTPKHARQMVVHKRVSIDGKRNNTPSYIVRVSEENQITVKKSERKPKIPVEEKQEEVKE